MTLLNRLPYHLYLTLVDIQVGLYNALKRLLRCRIEPVLFLERSNGYHGIGFPSKLLYYSSRT